jgi:hypothetical protein
MDQPDVPSAQLVTRKKWQKPILIAAIVAGSVFLFLGVLLAPAVIGISRGFIQFRHQMDAGRSYMDSLSSADIQRWIARSRSLQNELPRNQIELYGIGGKALPEDMKKLNIISVEVSPDRVAYAWMGGFDHTALAVERGDDGEYTVTAEYDDSNRRVLWPAKDKK